MFEIFVFFIQCPRFDFVSMNLRQIWTKHVPKSDCLMIFVNIIHNQKEKKKIQFIPLLYLVSLIVEWLLKFVLGKRFCECIYSGHFNIG